MIHMYIEEFLSTTDIYDKRQKKTKKNKKNKEKTNSGKVDKPFDLPAGD